MAIEPSDYQAYLDRLAKHRAQYDVALYAYCLMPNHVHLLLETSSHPLPKFMQGLQQSYTKFSIATIRRWGISFRAVP